MNLFPATLLFWFPIGAVAFHPDEKVGVDLPTVKRISGHKDLSMVLRYSHQNGAHIQAAMDKLQERMKTG